MRKQRNPLTSFKGCFSKQFYESEKIANKVGKQNTEKYGKKMRSYKCPNCTGWHLTTRMNKK